MQTLNSFFAANDFMPHGYCLNWSQMLLWMTVLSDAVITLAYYSIPLSLVYFVRQRKDLPFHWLFLLFGIFILACGTTHLVSVVTIWLPLYWLDAYIKLVTAIVSVIAALAMLWVIPRALLLPSPAQLEAEIVERKKAQDALQTSEAKQRAIFEATPDAIIISDEQGIISLANQQVESLLGYSANELVGQSIEILVPERFRASHPALRAEYAAAPFVRPMGGGRVVQAHRKDGRDIDVEISLSPIRTEQGQFFACALRDVTQRKQAEDALRASEARFRRMADFSPVMIWITDVHGTPTFVNKTWLEFTGSDFADSMSYEAWIKHIHPDDRERAFADYYKDIHAPDPITSEYRLQNANGDWRWILDKGVPMHNENGEFAGYIGSAIDITERKQVEQELEQLYLKNKWLQSFIDLTSDIFYLIGVDGKLQHWNASLERFCGLPPEQMAGRPCVEFVCAADRPLVEADVPKVFANGFHSNIYHFIRNDGVLIPFHCNGTVILNDQKEPVGFVGLGRDIAEREQAEADLRIAATAFESQEAMVITDADTVILRVNQAFSESTGYSAAEAVGHKINLLRSGRHDAAFYTAMWDSINATGSWQGEIWDRRKNGEIYPKWLTITAVKNSNGVITHYVGTHTDITQRKSAEDEIKHLAFYDPLTRLANRRLLLDRLQQALTNCIRSERHGALLFIDLDNFKTLNDTLGHDQGDLLLQQVANRIPGCVRDGDTVARLGGDEFVIMLEDLSALPLEAAAQSETIGGKVLATLNQPYLLGEHEHHSTPSIGITLFSAKDSSVDELLKRADIAMYQAKAAGRNTLRFFDANMQVIISARAAMEAGLRQGLQEQQFLLYYQPQVDETGYITGVEALIRWQHPQHGLISPIDFIPLAEETGLILPLGQWVLETASKQLASWAKQPNRQHLTVAVNVSARQLHRPDFVKQVLEVFERSGIDPGKLKLELTESLLVHNVEDIIEKMTALKAKGISFSLDDFGTGYSSLSYLKRLPLDQLKIDRSFVRDVLTDPNDASIARTIIALGQSLGLAVIAEGVETEAQHEFLLRSGCNAFQGYLFGQPQPAEHF